MNEPQHPEERPDKAAPSALLAQAWQSFDRAEREHPASEVLAAYAEGFLQGPAREACEKHLSSCPLCLRQVRDLWAYTTAVRPMPRSRENFWRYNMHVRRGSLLVLLLFIVASFPLAGSVRQVGNSPPDVVKATPALLVADVRAEEKEPVSSSGKQALLIACTKYPNLKDRDLIGPGNDVKLMEQLLREKFDFAASEIMILSEAAGGADRRPTYANIEREFQRLAKVAKKGDQIFILMSGHGSQQPADTEIPDNYEPDGFDETFLPADADKWDGVHAKVVNAIVDNQLGNWLKAIRARGAEVCIVVDSCHSGTMVRGNDEIRARQVDPASLIPQEVIDKAVKAAAQKAKEQKPPETTLAPDLVAIYAALRTQPTFEWPMPREIASRKDHGMLTFALCQVLKQAQSPLTYRELLQRVQAQYVAWGWNAAPTPFVEGKFQDREFLGLKEWPHRSAMVLSRQDDPPWTINAGALQGLTPGSILAVYDPPGKGDKVLGHVKVTTCRMMEVEVEPVAYAGKPKVMDLPDGGRCDLVFVDYGEQRLRIAVVIEEDKTTADAAEARKSFLKQMDRLRADIKPGAILEFISEVRAANWLVKFQNGKVYLSPNTATPKLDPATAPLYGPFTVDEDLPKTLLVNLRKIARAQNLLTLAGTGAGGVIRGEEAVSVEVQILRYKNAEDKEGTVILPSAGLHFADGDRIGFRLTNTGQTEVDVTLLFVGNSFGINSIFPEKGVVTDNRIPPGESRRTPRRPVRSGQFPGLDHVVVIAVEAKGPPVDFSCLEQTTLARARALGTGTLGNPLGQLLGHALYEDGDGKPKAARGEMGKADIEKQSLQLLSWEVLPAKTGK